MAAIKPVHRPTNRASELGEMYEGDLSSKALARLSVHCGLSVKSGESESLPKEMSELRDTNESTLNGGVFCFAPVVTID